MFKFLKDFFHLSNIELKGAKLLLFLIFFIFLVPRVYFYFQDSEDINDPEFEKWIVEMNFKEDSILAFNKSKYQKKNFNDKNKSTEKKLFVFNPNTVSFKEMKQLGFDGKTANILLKYRKKGAKFYTKKDLKKIYGFSDELYQKLENYIDLPQNSYNKNDKKKNDIAKIKTSKEYFIFDPNTVSYSEMKKLGIDGKTANILIKYRGNKTKFYSKEDLLKVYGFSEEKFVELEKYIVFPKKEKFVNSKEKNNNYSEDFVLDINTSSAKEFEKLKGIGPYFANEIVTYRTKLGGFYKIEQLKEVYGISDEVFSKIVKNISIGNTKLNKIDINKASFKTLIRHPYINKEITLAILKLKKELGAYTKVSDIEYYDIISTKDFQKIKHYLEVK